MERSVFPTPVQPWMTITKGRCVLINLVNSDAVAARGVK